MNKVNIIKKVVAKLASDPTLRSLSVDELHDSLQQSIEFMESSRSEKDKKEWLKDAINLKMELRKRGINVEVPKYKLPSMESIKEASTKEYIEKAKNLGKDAFHKGIKSVPVLDKDLMELVGKVKDQPFGFSTKLMKAWSDAWHKENLKKEVVSRLVKAEKMTLEEAWDILYKDFVEKTEIVKPSFKLDMTIGKEKQKLLRSIYDSAPVKQLYTYSTNKFGFKLEDIRVDVDHGNLKIQKITE